MRTITLLLALSIATAACAVDPSLGVTRSSSTTCVSDPLTGGGDDDDAVAHCPPPNTQQLAAATLTYAQDYAARNSIPDPTYDIGGGCFVNSHQGLTCIVVITFGGGSNVVITCNGPDNQNSNTRCTSG